MPRPPPPSRSRPTYWPTSSGSATSRSTCSRSSASTFASCFSTGRSKTAPSSSAVTPRSPTTTPGPRPTRSSCAGSDLLLGRTPQVGDGDRAPLDGLVGQPCAAVRALGADVELRIEVRKVLLDRGLAHHQLGGDLLERRRLGEEVAGEQRPAQHHEHVALARREGWTVCCRLGLGTAEISA